ncbi:Rpp14/Pop5 family protein [Nanoarchaeota archaeon]
MSKGKLKPILPSLKEKKRYLAIEVLSESAKFDAYEVENAVDSAVVGYIGTLGKGQAGAWMIKDSWDIESQMGLIRLNNRYVDEVKAALTLIQKVNGKEVLFRSRGLSGILKKAKKYIEEPLEGYER